MAASTVSESRQRLPTAGAAVAGWALAAFLLFCLTFAVNTVAELVRLKLRRKYRYL